MADIHAMLRFSKHGDLRLVSHHDLMRCVERVVRRAEIPLAQTNGFNPRPRITFALALALGIEGQREIVRLDLTTPMRPADLLDRLNLHSVPGLIFTAAELVEPGYSKLANVVSYAIAIPPERRREAESSLASFLELAYWPYARKREERTIPLDIRRSVRTAQIDSSGIMRFEMNVLDRGSARPEEVIEALGLMDLLLSGAVLARTNVELACRTPVDAIPATVQLITEPT